MAESQLRIALEIGHQTGDIRTSEFAVAVDITRYIKICAGGVEITTVGRRRSYSLEEANPIGDIAA